MNPTEMPYPTRHVQVHGNQMAYVEVGSGDPIVFLHGNPTSSYLWRGVLGHLAELGRCIAPDLIGMGGSDKLGDSGPGSYRFTEHRAYLDSLLEALDAEERVTFVAHDWGSALAFDWARRHPQAVRGLAYTEAIVGPMSWEDIPELGRDIFAKMRSSAGEEVVLEGNAFVESILPNSMLRELGQAEMDTYRRPYLKPGESRRPTLTWPRELPLEGQPADVVEITQAYWAWLAESNVPKLLISAEPGMILTGPRLEQARGLPNQTEVTVPGLHFVQEDSPDEIGRAVAEFVRSLP